MLHFRHAPRRTLSRILLSVLALGSALAMSSAGHGAAAAAQKTYVSHAVGVAVTIPTNWTVTTWSKSAGVGLNVGRPVAKPGSTQARFVTRLSIGVLGTTRLTDPRQAAKVFAQRQLRGLKGLKVQQRWVRYAGTPGIMLLGMPGIGPTVQVILAHRGVVYGISAPGRVLTGDQKAVLGSLRFVSMSKSTAVQKT